MGSLVSRMSSQENLAKGKGRAWGAERSSTEPFRKKDHATSLGAQRPLGGVGGCAHQQPGTRPPSTSGTSQRRSPAGGVPVTPLGATPFWGRFFVRVVMMPIVLSSIMPLPLLLQATSGSQGYLQSRQERGLFRLRDGRPGFGHEAAHGQRRLVEQRHQDQGP